MKGITNAEFRRLVTTPPHERVGVACSGGSDSIALLSLLADYCPVKAFTVNHNVRPSSTEEACRVHDQITRRGISHEILTLPKRRNRQILKGVEVERKVNEETLRTWRYTALTKACLRNGITSLFLGHHADDQHELIIQLLTRAQRWTSFAGMSAISQNPLSQVMKDAWKVRLHRPLLSIEKERVKQTCIDRVLEWSEDESNADASLTSRNAVRQLLRRPVPTALSRPVLLQFSQYVTSKRETVRKERDACLETLDVRVNTHLGSCRFNHALLRLQPDVIQESVLSYIATLVSPVLQPRSIRKLDTCDRQMAGCDWSINDGVCTVTRQPFSRGAAESMTAECWDNRYWITYQPGTTLRNLQKSDIHALRKSEFRDFIKSRKNYNFTIPVIVENGEVIGFPSFGIGRGFTECRHKSCDIRRPNDGHCTTV